MTLLSKLMFPDNSYHTVAQRSVHPPHGWVMLERCVSGGSYIGEEHMYRLQTPHRKTHLNHQLQAILLHKLLEVDVRFTNQPGSY